MGPEVDEAAATRLQSAMATWDQGTWCLAALTLAADPAADGHGPLAAAAREVLSAAGLGPVLGQPGRLPFTARELTGMAAAPLLQAAATRPSRRAPRSPTRATTGSTRPT